jgi:hypothetical protein
VIVEVEPIFALVATTEEIPKTPETVKEISPMRNMA